MILKSLIYIFGFGAVALLVYQLLPGIALAWQNIYGWRTREVEVQRLRLKETFVEIDPRRLLLLNIASPLVLGLIGFIVSRQFLGVGIGLGVGFAIPAIVIKNVVQVRKSKFHGQITDSLMILSSCLKGGLSLLQAMEVLAEELPPPISQEFGLILRENKMGVSLEESFERLNKRMPSEELELLTTAIMVARETGGDITQLFDNLVRTIRAKVKLNDNVKTLSLQGKIQGVVMSILPVVFSILVASFQPDYFKVMLEDGLGRSLLIYAVVSELIGVYMIKIFSTVRI